MKNKIEYQYFAMINSKTNDKIEFKIGPCPIPVMRISGLIKKAFKEHGKVYGSGKDWIIDSAWVAE